MKRKIILSVLVAGVCLWLVLRNINWRQVGEALEAVSYLPLLGAPAMLVLSLWFRARRWDVLLRPIRKIGMGELFSINAVGFLAINALPLRLGEMSRPILFKQRHQIPISTGLAAVAVERVFDGLVTVMALYVGILAAPEGFGEMPSLGINLRTMMLITLGIYGPILLFFILAVTRRDQALAIVFFLVRALPRHHRDRVSHMADNFFEGLKSLPDLKSFAWILVESLWVWLAVAMSYAFAIQAFHLHIPWSAAFTILGVAAVGVMIPSPPGFVGTFQLFVMASLALYGVPKSTALAYSIVIHAINLGQVLLLGLLCAPKVSTKVGTLISDAMESSKSSSSS